MNQKEICVHIVVVVVIGGGTAAVASLPVLVQLFPLSQNRPPAGMYEIPGGTCVPGVAQELIDFGFWTL